MGGGIGTGPFFTESTLKNMSHNDILARLAEVAGKHFNVDAASLDGDTTLESLKADEHDLEELRIEFENAVGDHVHTSFDEAKTLGDIERIIRGELSRG